ncbi:hypothetical protein FACS1894216_13480 [Synergistales bacterium]|nr:hypothetical protein FACS1894216_13480 [Synergistales bacterium]
MMRKFFLGITVLFLLVGIQCSADAADFPTFASQTLDKESISSDIFSKKKITMLYVWWDGCGYCEEEMPMLGDLARSMPEGSQMVGLLTIPHSENMEPKYLEYFLDSVVIPDVKSIMAKASADFPNILGNKELYSFAKSITGAPTVIFVNSTGEIVGPTLVGVYVDSNGKTDNPTNEKELRYQINKILSGENVPGEYSTDNYDTLPETSEKTNDKTSSDSGGSGGGCSALGMGFGGLALAVGTLLKNAANGRF